MQSLALVQLLISQTLAATHVSCSATTGDFLIEMTPERGPIGAQRFLELVEDGFFTDIPMFRVLPGFLVQYGIPGRMDLKSTWEKWTSTRIKDDPHLGENNRDKFMKGDMSFAGAGADSRTTQVFVTYRDGTGLGGALHEVPFGKVIKGMENVEAFYSGYGDTHPFGNKGPVQSRMWSEGNTYLKKEFDKLDYINECHVVKEEGETTKRDLATDDSSSDSDKDQNAEQHDKDKDRNIVDLEANEAHSNDVKVVEVEPETPTPVVAKVTTMADKQSVSPVFVVAIFVAAAVVLFWIRRSGFAYRKLRVL
eukprot:TRINITY_DN15961_c0_g1_i1.p1 TRINITY_DN15961_c0_g1~~TRINITY_DN15961_c0_g1_i1.p1  ORF type:complete len:325 (+),score=66.79 TRINITY_DN15961_c0_g1_i1:53-976(+)